MDGIGWELNSERRLQVIALIEAAIPSIAVIDARRCGRVGLIEIGGDRDLNFISKNLFICIRISAHLPLTKHINMY